MAETSTVARPYANAAFDQAREEDRLEQWSEMLALLDQVSADRLMKGAIASPKVDEAQIAALIIDVCGEVLSDTGRNFVRLLAEFGRLDSVAEIRAIFEQRRSQLEGRAQVRVSSAFELDAAQLQAIREAMARRLGKDVEISVEVDRSLIGGLVIRAGDSVIDASMRGRLAQLGQSLL